MTINPDCMLIIRAVTASMLQTNESDINIYHLPCDEAVKLLRKFNDDEHSLKEICFKQRIVDEYKITYGNQSYKDKDPLNCKEVADRIENIMLRSKL